MDILSYMIGKQSGGGITPTGKLDITNTNEVDVSTYATAQVVDSDLVAENIKKDVDILGVVGTFEGSGGGLSPADLGFGTGAVDTFMFATRTAPTLDVHLPHSLGKIPDEVLILSQENTDNEDYTLRLAFVNSQNGVQCATLKQKYNSTFNNKTFASDYVAIGCYNQFGAGVTYNLFTK